nr:hypothetical protein [Tanacetum cinerariifolium]
SKDETSDILKKFITEIENLKDYKVKIIRVLVNKMHNKTPYELFNGRTPARGFHKPFGCHVMILNTLDNLGTKVDASKDVKKDVSSLRYIVLPNWVHEEHLESTLSQPQDTCNTDTPESSGNSNLTATSTNPPADQLEILTVETPIPTVSSPALTICFTDSQEPSSETRLILKRVTNQEETPSLDNILALINKFEDILGVTSNSEESNGVEADVRYMETSITASPIPTLRIHRDHPKSQIIGPADTPIQTRNKSKEIFDALQDPSWVDYPKGVRPIGTKWVLKNKKDERGIVIRNKARLLAQGHTPEEGIDYDEVFAPVARIKAIRLFLAYASFMGFIVYQMDVKSAFLYGTIDEEVYVMQPPGFQDPEYPTRVYKVEKAMYGLHQAPRAWQIGDFILVQVYLDDIIFGSSNPQLCREFEALMPKKFQMSAMDVRSLNTPMDKENPWGKDGTGKDVDLHLYRSMIGSLMYLTASRPDIMFAVYSPFDLAAFSDSDYGGATQDRKSNSGGCQFSEKPFDAGRFQYLVGHPKLGLWYPKASPFDLVSFSDSDYGGASQDQYHRVCDMIHASALDFVSLESQISAILAAIEVEIEHSLDVVDMFSIRFGVNANTINELMALCTSLQMQHSELLVQFQAQKVEINKLNAKVKILEDNQGVIGARSTDDAPIKGRRIDEEDGITRRVSSDTEEIRMDEGEVAVERTSDDTEEMATVLTSMDAATVLAGGIDVPTSSDFIPTAGPPVVDIHTGSDVVPTASPIVATATVVTPYSRRKGKEVMVESDTPKKQRIHAEEELQESTEKTMDQKAEEDYYMTLIRNNLGWKVKDFKGMTFEEIEEKFAAVWKLVEDFIPMGLKEEAERLKRKGFNLEQEKAKKQKTSKEVPDKEKSPEEIPEVKVHIDCQRSYWKIIRLGGSSACYQFFVDLLKHLDREDLNQLWVLVKEYLSIRPSSSDKEMELWVELKRLHKVVKVRYKSDDPTRTGGIYPRTFQLEIAVLRKREKAVVNSPQPIYDQEPSMVDEDDEDTYFKKVPPSSPTHISSSSIPTITQSEQTPLRQYTRRVRIAQSSTLPPVANEPASPVRDVSEGEACPTDSGFIADQDRATIAKSSTLPHDTALRVTSPAAVEGKENQGVIGARSADDAPIKGRRIEEEEGITGRISSDIEEIRMDEGEVAVERTSEDTEEMATVLTSMDAATVLAGGIDVPTGSDSIPTAGPPVVVIHTGSDAVPTASPIRLQEQIDAQVTRDLEEQQEREDKRMTKQIARDVEMARIHAEEELQGMIDSLDRTNETIDKYLQEYQDFDSELPLERRIELISDLVKYQDNYLKIYKFQSQQRRPWTKKQKKDYYMTVIKNNLGWKEEAERLKRKGFNLEKEKAKKQKTSEEVPDKEKSPEEIPEEKVKEMM